MDTFAKASIIDDNILNKSDFRQFRKERYYFYDSGIGKAFEEGKLTIEDLHAHAIEAGEPEARSGRQEYFENFINRHI